MRSESRSLDAPQLQALLVEQGADAVWPADQSAPTHSAHAGQRVPALRPMAEQVAELEHQAIHAALAHTGGNKLAAARLLGISRATLYNRLGQDLSD